MSISGYFFLIGSGRCQSHELYREVVCAGQDASGGRHGAAEDSSLTVRSGAVYAAAPAERLIYRAAGVMRLTAIDRIRRRYLR